MRNLLIDFTFLKSGETPFSIAYYTGRLLYGFRDSNVFCVYALVWNGMENDVDDYAGYQVRKIVIDKGHYVTPWPIVDRLFSLVSFEKELAACNIDVVLHPDYFDCRLFFSKKFRQHCIVHDLIPYYSKKDEWGGFKFACWRIYRRIIAKKLSHYISISEETRHDLKRLDGVDSVVVYNSLPFDFYVKEIPINEIMGKQYILDVNRLERYKNAEMLIRAYDKIKDSIPHILYLKADNRHQKDYEHLQNLITSLELEDRIIIDRSHRSEGEMRYLYGHADLFVTPSLKEGFGWTPLEAAILETPVLVSDISVLREVTCGKIPSFNPYSISELASRMMDMLQNPPSVASRKKLAKFYLDKYSLQNQIGQLTDVLLGSIESSSSVAKKCDNF